MAKKPKKVSRGDLGKGIQSLLGGPELEQEAEENREAVVRKLTNTVAMIPLEQIETNPYQPRNEFDQEALEQLSASIKTYGLIQPITLRRLSPGAYQLISGERRFRASNMAGLKEVPAYIRLADDQEMLEMALVENIQRQDLNAMEIALSYHRLKEECQLTDEELAERVGKKRSTVTNYRSLLELSPNIQEAVKKGELSMGHARELIRVEDVILRQELFKKALALNLSVRALERMARDYKKTSPEKKPHPIQKTHEYEAIEHKLRSYFGNKKVQLNLKGKDKGQIVLPFNSVDELNELLDRLDD